MRAARVTLALALVLAASPSPGEATTAKLKLAILGLENPAELADQEVEYLTETLRLQAKRALGADEFVVMTRENILEYLPPGKTLAECEGSCEVETGRMVGADFVVTGAVLRFGTQLKVQLRVHDTATGELRAADEASGLTVDALELPVKEAARRLLEPLSARGARAAEAKVQVSRVAEPEDDGSRIRNPPRDERGFLKVRSTPKGSRVFINGEEKGATPWEDELMVGDYVVLVKPLSSLYAAASQRVTVTTAKQTVEMELPATFGNLRVESDPPGAEILLGGEPTGKVTPHTFKEKAGGRYPVTVRRPLYRDATQQVELGGGRDSLVNLSLAPDFGVLEVTSTPPGAEILLDGEPTGKRTPHTFPARRTGEVEVTVSLAPLYLPQVRKVRLGEGKRTAVDAALGANFGRLEVTSAPSGMPVLLDGEPAGTTPLSLAEVSAGAHEVRIAAPRYAAPPQRASVGRGETAALHFALKPRLGRLNLRAVVVDRDSREPAEAEVWLDGEALDDRTPLKKELLVGSYTLRLSAPEAKPRELTVSIAEGEETREEVALEKLLPAEVIAARVAEDRRRTGHWLVGSGVTAALVGATGFVYARTAGLGAVNDAGTQAELDAALGTGRWMGLGGAALAGAGALSVLSGLIAYAIAD